MHFHGQLESSTLNIMISKNNTISRQGAKPVGRRAGPSATGDPRSGLINDSGRRGGRGQAAEPCAFEEKSPRPQVKQKKKSPTGANRSKPGKANRGTRQAGRNNLIVASLLDSVQQLAGERDALRVAHKEKEAPKPAKLDRILPIAHRGGFDDRDKYFEAEIRDWLNVERWLVPHVTSVNESFREAISSFREGEIKSLLLHLSTMMAGIGASVNDALSLLFDNIIDCQVVTFMDERIVSCATDSREAAIMRVPLIEADLRLSRFTVRGRVRKGGLHWYLFKLADIIDSTGELIVRPATTAISSLAEKAKATTKTGIMGGDPRRQAMDIIAYCNTREYAKEVRAVVMAESEAKEDADWEFEPEVNVRIRFHYNMDMFERLVPSVGELHLARIAISDEIGWKHDHIFSPTYGPYGVRQWRTSDGTKRSGYNVVPQYQDPLRIQNAVSEAIGMAKELPGQIVQYAQNKIADVARSAVSGALGGLGLILGRFRPVNITGDRVRQLAEDILAYTRRVRGHDPEDRVTELLVCNDFVHSIFRRYHSIEAMMDGNVARQMCSNLGGLNVPGASITRIIDDSIRFACLLMIRNERERRQLDSALSLN